MNILIVDDIAVNRKLLCAILEAEGHSIMEAADGAEALVVLKHEKVDAIISDILMPRMDGYRFCYEVRTSEHLRHLPFIFYTSSYTSSSDEKLALEMGADKFLTKPAPASKIIQALREASTRKRVPFAPMEPLRDLNLMKEYNQQLVAKLEQKNTALTARNEELLSSEQKLLLQSTALETAANAVVITDTNGIILWVNSSFVALTGYTSEETIGKTPRLLKSGQHVREFYQNLWTTILAGRTWRGNFSNRRKDGSLYHDEHTITPVRSKQGAITHFIAIMTDVTERQRAEQKLRESEERLETVTEKLTEGLVLSDLDGQVLRWNRAALEMHGFTNDSERRHQLNEFTELFECSTVGGVVLPLEQWPLSRVLRNESVRNLEVRLRRIGSDWQRIFSHSGAIVREPSGKQIAFLTINDITKRKHAEDEIRVLNAELEQRVVERTVQLQAANHELEAFSYSVSHDLRAPVRHVVGFVELLQREAGPSLSVKSLGHLKTISQSAKRMGDLIDDLLAFSRIGQSEMQKKGVNLDDLVRETLGDFQAETRERNIVWTIHALPTVRADRALLRLVLVNLISNALKFTGARTEAKIEIGCAPAGSGETVIFIRDNGAGFDPKYAEKLFGVFQRLHSQDEFEGTGVGLANVQRIICRHGGRVWAEGVVNGGATFYFSILKQSEFFGPDEGLYSAVASTGVSIREHDANAATDVRSRSINLKPRAR
jgi:PAS domain S-box-containing protein